MGRVSTVAFSYTRTVVDSNTFRHEFEWKREECFILRKPDPAVLVAQTKEPPGKLQTRNVQILDYNINRCAPSALILPIQSRVY